MKTVLPVVVLLFSSALVFAQDAVQADRAHHKVVLENEYVRVLRITLPPGEKTALHHHPDHAVVLLTDAQNRVTIDGKANDSMRKAGDAFLGKALTHMVENVGKTTLDVILVELKSSPKGAPVKADPAKVDPKHYTVVAEDEHLRILRGRYAAGEKSVMHDHPPLVAVMLSDERFRMHLPDGKTQETPAGPRGTAVFAPAGSHLPENIGKGTAEVVLVELKPNAT